MSDLSGKVALVTGGSRGIGAEIARALARKGAAVAFTYHSATDRAHALEKQIQADGGRALAIQADNADAQAVRAAVDSVAAEFGGLDLRGFIALGDYGHAQDVAGMVAYLAGPGGRQVSGSSILVDGGFAA